VPKFTLVSRTGQALFWAFALAFSRCRAEPFALALLRSFLGLKLRRFCDRAPGFFAHTFALLVSFRTRDFLFVPLVSFFASGFLSRS
jgi:hypothetical protein